MNPFWALWKHQERCMFCFYQLNQSLFVLVAASIWYKEIIIEEVFENWKFGKLKCICN